MHKVILDANILMAPVQFGFNLDIELSSLIGEFEGIVTEATLGELEKLDATKNIKRTAKALAQRYRAVRTTNSGDNAILEAGETYGAIIATADRGLQKRAISRGLKVIVIREGNRLAWYS